MFFSSGGSPGPPGPLLTTLRREKSAPESSFSCKTGPEKPSDSDLFIGGPPWPFSWQISHRKTQSMPKTKTHPFLEVKSGSDMGVFSQKNLVLKTFRSGSNPGVLRGFPERESGNRSPIRACFPGADIPFRARNKAGSGGSEETPEENERNDPGVADVPARSNDRSTSFCPVFSLCDKCEISREIRETHSIR